MDRTDGADLCISSVDTLSGAASERPVATVHQAAELVPSHVRLQSAAELGDGPRHPSPDSLSHRFQPTQRGCIIQQTQRNHNVAAMIVASVAVFAIITGEAATGDTTLYC